MKYLLLIIAFQYSINSKSQAYSMENISDYSYFLFEMKNNEMKQGTGFFIKKNNKTYLVTASHNFHVDKTATEKTTNEFYLRLERKGKKEFLLIKNNPLPKTESTKNLDINFYELNIPSDYEINIIDIESIESTNPENIICFGYAVVDGNEDNPQLYAENLKPTEFRGKVKFEYQKPIKYFETQEIDYYNYVVEYKTDRLGRGTSGSPVFSVTEKNGIPTYKFAGLIHLRNEETKIATILRPEKIMDIIRELK